MPFFDKYPYTNFHNVNLDWVLERVKEWGALVEQNNTAFHNLEEANEDFKNYVTGYLENLDIQTQIDDKLDRMFKSGELTDYLQPYVSTTVTTWLDENITEPTGVVIDSSLTVEGACADAKSAGDKIFANTLSILYNGLTGEIRDAILQCFNNVAWVNTQGQLFYNYLKNALTAIGYIKMHWNTKTDSEICIKLPKKAVYGATVNGHESGVLKTNAVRGTVVLTVGASSLLNEDLTDSGYYLIPIPDKAIEVRISSPDNNYLFWVHERIYYGIDHVFGYVGTSSDASNPCITDIKTNATYGKANLLAIYCKRTNEADVSTLPEIDILFTE